MSLPHDLASRLGPESIFVQLAAAGLLPESVTAVIDLSNGPADHRLPPRPGRRRTRWPRGAAVLRAVASEDGRRLLAWCPFCHKEHVHGRCGGCAPGTCDCPLHSGGHGRCTCPVGSGDGHRVAHCRPGSPLRATGYYVQEIGP